LILDAKTRQTRLLQGENLPLGVREGEVYRQRSAPLAPGDTLLLFSDGITDARDAAGRVFGLERLEECVRQHAALEPSDLIEAVNGAVREFSGLSKPSDDQTSVAIRVDQAALPVWHGEAELRSDLGELARVRAFVRAFCRDAPGQPLDAAAVAALELAVNEAASNIMKHAYAGDRDQPIRIDADAYVDRVSVRLRHVGSPFQPERAKEPTFNGTRESGFGTFIITSSVDDARYYRDASGRNCVALIKKRIQPAAEAV
jgi:anti-sigma regulatory factor (Ser/Thr protein kinase)